MTSAPGSGAAGVPVPGLDAALRAIRPDGRPRAIVLPAPVTRPERMWSLARPGETAVFWAPPGGPMIAGLGEAAAVRWPTRTVDERADHAASTLLRRIETVFAPGAPHIAPMLIGGGPFDPERAPGRFAPLGPGRLVLPRWTYVARAGGAALLLVLDSGIASDRVRALAERTEAVLRLLASDAPPPPPATGPARRWIAPSADAWRERFEAARKVLARGELTKVVLAHAGEIEADGPIDAVAALARLIDRDDPVTVYGIRAGDAAFVGATPETLFALRSGHLLADALAGTISASDAAAPGATAERLGERLLASAKDRREQQIVVEAVADALSPLCTGLEIPARPAIRLLGRVAHLSTPISSAVRPGVGWETLVRALHPTPAVGGHPREAALRFLRAIEPESRGWFAGPFGVVERGGDARFAVAIRSALVDGPRAVVWAGAGIVDGSRAEAEYEETLAKMRRLRAALGVPP